MSNQSTGNPLFTTINMQRSKIIITLAVLTVTLFSCSKKEQLADSKPRSVITHTVQSPQLKTLRKFNGVTKASNSAELGFEIAGRIIELPAVSGKQYGKGAILAKLDTASFEALLRQAQAEATRSKQELIRVQQLFESDNSSKANLDQAIAAHKSAGAALQSANQNVSNGVLRMPYDGVIGDVLKEKQEVVSAGIPVLLVQGEGPMEIDIGVTSKYINAVKVGMKAKVTLPGISKKLLNATVTKVSPQASENTTYPVTLTIHADDLKIRDGLDGEVTLTLPSSNATSVRVPISCIVGAAGGQRYVFVIKKLNNQLGVVEKRIIKAGALANNAMVEVIDGLSAGEVILARGVHQIEAGTNVSLSE